MALPSNREIMKDLPDSEIRAELRERETAAREAEHREKVLAMEMRTARRLEEDTVYAVKFGLTIEQYREIEDHVLERDEEDRAEGL